MRSPHSFLRLFNVQRSILMICWMTIGCFFAENLSADDSSRESQLAPVTVLMQDYCFECHNSTDATAELNLEDFDVSVAMSHSQWDTTQWEQIVKRLVSRQMPPRDSSRPTEAEYNAAITVLETVLDGAAKSHPQPGRTESIRRLNRTEYGHAIRDLMAMDVDIEHLLPADQSGHGFDNVTVGNLPPVLLSRYITAAEHVSRLAVGRNNQKSPSGTTIRLPADRTQDSHVDGLPLGTRGGTVFEHQFAVAGEYEIQLRLMRDRDERIEGLVQEPHDIDVLLDRDLVHRFTITPPEESDEWGRDFTLADAHLKKRFRVTAGPHDVGVTFPSQSSSLSEIRRQPFDASFNRHRHPRKAPALYEVSIVGPFGAGGPGDTPARRKIFRCTPKSAGEASECAEKILRPFLRLAYRRPVIDTDLVVPMRFFATRFDTEGFDAGGFDAGIETALSAILVNPHFLFRTESDPDQLPAGAVYKISDIELASRLSFFLWSSIPDEELLQLAEANRLHEPDVMRSQVQRMLNDGKSQSLVDNFASQWLYLRNLDSLQPDRRLFPDFDDNLRHAMRRETELLFDDVIQNDRSVLDLIRSETTFLNERLAKHYGIPHVFGSHFRSVPVAGSDYHRGGILRHASVLAVTSYATRTSPTIRGNWILENVLGTPAPPPPPNVPSLKEKTADQNVTVRERLAEHRANPACASCHNLMDPVGFALENYDAVGRWRVFEHGQAIDSAGALPDGQKTDNVEELEYGIMERPDLFVATLTEKLLTFALGRGVEPYDSPAIRKVVRAAADKDYCFSEVVTGIALSTPFQMRVRL